MFIIPLNLICSNSNSRSCSSEESLPKKSLILKKDQIYFKIISCACLCSFSRKTFYHIPPEGPYLQKIIYLLKQYFLKWPILYQIFFKKNCFTLSFHEFKLFKLATFFISPWIMDINHESEMFLQRLINFIIPA